MRALAFIVLAGCATESPEEAYVWHLPGELPVPRVPANNPMTEAKVTLGRYLFYDTRLSGDGTQSCATCHAQERAFTDGRTVPVGITGEPGRHNAMSLANVAYNSSNTWAAHVTALEAQARLPMFGTHPVELGLADDATLLARLSDEPRYAGLTADDVVDALACFERTIVSGSSRFDQFVAGDAMALTAGEQRGLALFESDRLGCTHCHGGFNLASSYDTAAMSAPQIQFFNNGLYDVDGAGAYPAGDQGLIEITGEPGDMGRFRAPTLRNIAATAPYFHDGSAPTLDAVLDHYAQGGVHGPLQSPFVTGFALEASERADLLAFFTSLTDDALRTDPALASPW